MTAYAIWAPGVGYLTNEPYTPDRKMDPEHRHNLDLSRAQVFGTLECAYRALQKGQTQMGGIEIRKLEPAPPAPQYIDVGVVA